MGKTPKPLSILIHPSIIQTDEDRELLQTMREQGHTIDLIDENIFRNELGLIAYNIILAPNAWRAFSLKHFDLAIKSARAVKYKSGEPKEKKPRKPRKKKGSEDGPVLDN